MSPSCRTCGRQRAYSYEAPFVGGECWNCRFWAPFILRRHESCMVRYRGHHMQICGDLEQGRRGYRAGTLWRFEFLDGRVVLAEFARVQGSIPERFRAQLPDNARRVTTNFLMSRALECECDELPDPLGCGNLEEEDEPRVYPSARSRAEHVKPQQGSLF